MTRVMLDDALRSKLLDLRQPLELCDGSGRVVGVVTPYKPGPYFEPPPMSEEELQRREQEPDYSTEEVLAHLEKL